jgi:hypothetical protein
MLSTVSWRWRHIELVQSGFSLLAQSEPMVAQATTARPRIMELTSDSLSDILETAANRDFLLPLDRVFGRTRKCHTDSLLVLPVLLRDCHRCFRSRFRRSKGQATLPFERR